MVDLSVEDPEEATELQQVTLTQMIPISASKYVIAKRIKTIVIPELIQRKSTFTRSTAKNLPPVQVTPTRILSLSPREVDPNRSFPLGWRYNSIIKGYGEDYDDAKTGDMIMATASDINHPAYLTGKVGMMYIVFGVVRCFIYCDYDTGKGDDEWDGVVKDQ